MTASPVGKVYAVFSKKYDEEKYSVIEKLDKDICLEGCIFPEEIGKLLEGGVFAGC